MKAPGVIQPPPQVIQTQRKPRAWVKGAIIIAWLLWGLSVALPVWDTRSDHTGEWGSIPGFIPLLLGWLGIFAKCPAWFANLLLIPLCMAFYKWPKAGFPLSLGALALAASAYVLPGLYGDNDVAIIEVRRIGFYLWLGSFATLALAHAFLSPPTTWQWIAARVALVALMVLGIAALEKIYPVGVSPLEAALKNHNDQTSLGAALAHHPSQADKDAALWWAIQQDLSSGDGKPSKSVVMLLAAGANPNQSKSGDPLLIQALPRRGSMELVEALVKAGADVNTRDSRGKTVLDCAREMDSGPECEKFLIGAGAKTGGIENPK